LVDFLHDVKPILAQRCFRCHSSLEQESNLRLDSVPAILKGGDGGPVAHVAANFRAAAEWIIDDARRQPHRRS
jgi:hypothetical protein